MSNKSKGGIDSGCIFVIIIFVIIAIISPALFFEGVASYILGGILLILGFWLLTQFTDLFK
jgi:positive regulator of sigma E activity